MLDLLFIHGTKYHWDGLPLYAHQVPFEQQSIIFILCIKLYLFTY